MRRRLHGSPRALGPVFGMSLALLVAACADPAPRTEVLVVIDADQAVRGESVKLRVVVRGGRGETMGGLDDRFFRDFDVTPSSGWPVQLGVIPLDGDVARLFEIEAAGIDAARREVTLVRARTGFASGRTLVLRLQLEDECRGVVCTDRQTCTAGVCGDVVLIPVAELSPYDPGTLLPDSGVPMPTVCATDEQCDDGVFCNGRERCLDLLCAPGTRVVCDDGIGCTRDVCRVNACVAVPDDSACTAATSGRCMGALGCQYGECTATTCSSDAMACETAVCSGATCMRMSTCAMGQTCCGGSCGPVGCDDGNDCTLDACEATGCTHTARMGAACNDGDSCTAGDVCGNGGLCGGSPRSCDDMNPCSDDSCLAGAGCVNTPNAIPCNDGNACTLGDVCASGACNPGIACDDGIACTADRCDPTGCVFTPNSGLCVAGPGGTCNPTTGCQYMSCDAATCAPGNPCETASCSGPTCVRTPVVCPPDTNPCTDEVCDLSRGCQSVNNVAACDDGNVCTVGDRCATGVCVGAPNPCDDGNACTGTACTRETGCTYVVTVGAACGPVNLCESHTCDGTGICRDATTVCGGSGGSECTTDYCDSTLGCLTTNNDGASCCSGGGLGSCMGGTCVQGPPPAPVCSTGGG